MADGLATAYTVATYDPRGMSRSVLDDPGAEQRVAEHADDALRLLDLLSPGEPARVFGTSSGAVAALRLLTDRPDRIERLVAHEPPLVEVLPDAPAHRALVARVQETLHAQGLMPAMAVFAAGLKKDDGGAAEPKAAAEASPQVRGVDLRGAAAGPQATEAGPQAAEAGPQAPVRLPPRAAARAERTMANLPYFVGRIVPAFMSYVPDVPRLATLSDRLVLAGGEDSRGELPYRPAAFLAERLGTALLHFPGGHTGLTTHPAEFGERLHKALLS
ncbi:alpha/beta fold hydrolase [Streptomyces silvensis]|uniref:alpha/beta fold hydrolase n=1 Tax=Streptomyces silvensis TaxID=1765722 RepID=UPI003D67A7D7